MSYIYLNKKTKSNILTLFNTNSSLLIWTIVVLLSINGMKNWLFSLQNFWYNLPKIFHLNDSTVVLNVTLTIYPHIEFMLLAGCHRYTKLYDTSVVLKWHTKKEVLQQTINAKSVAYVGNKSIQLKLSFLPLNILHSLEQLTII